MTRSIYFREVETWQYGPAKTVVSISPPLGELAAKGLCNELTDGGEAVPPASAANITREDEDRTTIVVTANSYERLPTAYDLVRYIGSLLSAEGAGSNTNYRHVINDTGTHHSASGATHSCEPATDQM
jgi:hypothetical protein